MPSFNLTPHIRTLLDLAYEEDLGAGDVTSDPLFAASDTTEAWIQARQDLVLAGMPVVQAFLQRVDASLVLETTREDGQAVAESEAIARITGPVASILKAERTCLNFLQHLSGIATLTRAFVEKARAVNPVVRIVDTRKTLPGFRALAKYAVRCGGGLNHRFHLGDAAMLKDNHIAAAGSIAEAVAALRAKIPHTCKIEVEADTLDQVVSARSAGADIILLDNMSPETIRNARELAGKGVILEVSGGITLDNVGQFAETGVSVISVGAITHSAPAADIALNFKES